MIDIQSEELVAFAQACKRLPRRRGDKRPHVATIHRWAKNGVRGVRLEWVQVGGTKCTSMQALQRFFVALTAQEEAPTPVAGRRGTAMSSAEVDAELDAEGL